MVEFEEIPLHLYFDRPDLAARIIDRTYIDHYSRDEERIIFHYYYDIASDSIRAGDEVKSIHHQQQWQKQKPGIERDPEQRVRSAVREWMLENGEAIHRALCEKVGYCVLKEKYESEIGLCKSLIDSLVSLHFWLPVPLSTLVVYLVQKKYLDGMCQQYRPVASRRGVNNG